MWIAKTKAELRARLDAAARPVVLVPTMGALHGGHASLISLAREKAGAEGTVLVSIFVNPIQFDRAGDLAAYPRPLAADLGVCEASGADGVFVPEEGGMYPADRSVTVTESSLSAHLCGAARPGHFDGVCTVVLKLFLLTGCDAAVFGEKDFQQLAVIRRMARDLDLRTQIIPHPTVRECDGLAMSSRNTRLPPALRADAPRIRRALLAAAGESDAASMLRVAAEVIGGSEFASIDYLSLVDAETLAPTENLAKPAILACAVFYGEVRLIDHIAVGGSFFMERMLLPWVPAACALTRHAPPKQPADMSEPKHFVGLDIGGSTVKAVIIDPSGERVGPIVEVKSLVKNGYEATFGQLDLAIAELCGNAGITVADIGGIGLDVPAPSSNGVIWGKANLGDDWVGTNICGLLKQRLGIPVTMTNDCNAAAVGEYAIRNKHLGGLLLVAPGTGLGGGFVLPGGHLYEGANGLALEVGHISVPFREDDGSLPNCTCGLTGCLEAWVSLVALRRRLAIELSKPIWETHDLNAPGHSIEEKAFQLRTLAENGDALAIQLFRQQGFILGYGIADLVRVFDPGLVVLGGGLAESKFRDRFMEWVIEGFTDRAWSVYRHSPIEPEKATTVFEWAEGGDAAASIGMAYTARELFSA